MRHLDRTSLSTRRVWLVTAALVLGCGGAAPPSNVASDGGLAQSDGGTATPDGGAAQPDGGTASADGGATPDAGWPFAAEDAWGPEGTPLPVGAEVVSIERFTELSRSEGFELLSAAALAAARERGQQKYEAAKTLVQERLGRDPRYAGWFPPDSAPLAPNITRSGNGGYLWTSPTTGEVFVLDGERESLHSLAYSLQETNARPNLEKRYRALYEMFSEEERQDLPPTDALAALTDDELKARLPELAARIEPAAPRQVLDEGPDPGGLGCNIALGMLSKAPDNPGWQLRAYETPIRDQGRRGTCAAHAVVAGLELAFRKKHGFSVDLSEQELYADAKGIWFPTQVDVTGGLPVPDFTDGLPTRLVLEEMIDRNYRLDVEARWPYNPSWSRVTDTVLKRYTHSCDGYSGFCSDTNHQQKRVCTTGNGLIPYCGYVKPPAVAGLNVGQVRLKEVVSLMDPLDPMGHLPEIRAHLNAGNPVVIGAGVGDQFISAVTTQKGFVHFPFSESGGHAMLVVGYMPYGLVPERFRRVSPVDGYFVLKNSWGCAGDAGHVYVSSEWMASAAHTAVAITNISTDLIAPTIRLDRRVQDAVVADAHSVPFTMQINRAVAKLELFRVQGPRVQDGPRLEFEQTFAIPEEALVRFHVQFFPQDDGINTFLARVYDISGNQTAEDSTGLLVRYPDTLAPEISLSASETTVFAPGSVTLTAPATDNTRVDRVEFLKGLSVIAVDRDPPYSLQVPLGLSQLGTNNFVAIAHDGRGNQRVSNIVSVNVLGPTARPIIGGFTATPQTLPAGGGPVALAWHVLGATSVEISPGLGAVAPISEALVAVTQSKTFTLTATNAAGTSTATAPVLVAQLIPPEIEAFGANPPQLPAQGGASTLSWTVTGPVDSLTLDPGGIDVKGTTSRQVNVSASTTYTLTATNAAGSRTRNFTLTVAPDTTAPTVSLASSATLVVEPGRVTLTATATDDVGVVRVEFVRGTTVIDTDATPADGFSTEVGFGPADVGTATFTARAHDLAGNVATSAPVVITITPQMLPPTIDAFTAMPSLLPAGGGTTTLAWTASGATTLSIDQGVGDVTLETETDVVVAATTTFRLTAANATSSVFQDVTVTVLPDTTAPSVMLTTPSTMVTEPTTVTLTALATDDVAVTRVEFLRGAAVIATDTTPEDGFSTQVMFGPADVGVATFTAKAYDAASNTTTSAPLDVTVAARPSPPTIDTFTATPDSLPAAGGMTTLAWTVSGATSLSIDQGVGSVTGLTDKTVGVTATTKFTLTATNVAGNTTREVTVTVLPDTTPPTVSLQSSSTMVIAPTTVTLTANASDDVGVEQVEFYKDGVLVATDDTGGDGFSTSVMLTQLDEGPVAFTAVAKDLAGNEATSNEVTVTVTLPDTNFYVSPTGNNTGNTTCALATPCLTIAHAATQAGSGGTVVLKDGTFDTSTQGTGNITIPNGVTVQAQNDRMAIVKNVLSFAGSGGVIGLRIDRSAPNAQTTAGILATNGTLLIEGVDFKGSFGAAGAAVRASGTAVVTMRPGTVTDYTAETVALASVAGPVPFLHVLDTAQLTVEGGAFGGPGLGAQAASSSNGAGAAVLLRNNAKLTLQGVTLIFNTNGVAVLESSELHMVAASQLKAGAVNGTAAGGALWLERNAAGEVPKAFVTDSTIDGDASGAHASACVFTAESGTGGELTLLRSTLRGCTAGLRTLSSASMKVVATDSHVKDNTVQGVECQGACDFDFTGGSIANNAIGASASRGGLWMGGTSVAHRLKLRGVSVTGNNASASNSTDNSGMTLRGNASSVFDLGTTADPGNNVFQNNSAGSQSANVVVNVASGVVVSAVGNTWNANVQGADANGQLAVGTVTSASTPGANYRITAGSLKTSE